MKQTQRQESPGEISGCWHPARRTHLMTPWSCVFVRHPLCCLPLGFFLSCEFFKYLSRKMKYLGNELHMEMFFSK